MHTESVWAHVSSLESAPATGPAAQISRRLACFQPAPYHHTRNIISVPGCLCCTTRIMSLSLLRTAQDTGCSCPRPPLAECATLCMWLGQVDELYAGEVGWLSASIRSVADARVGDTITLKRRPAQAPLPGTALPPRLLPIQAPPGSTHPGSCPPWSLPIHADPVLCALLSAPCNSV